MFERIKIIFRKANALDVESLNYLKKGLIGMIILDMFAVYYYLGWKRLGLAILLVTMIGMAIVLYLLNSKIGMGFTDIRKTAQTIIENKINKNVEGGKMETEQVEQKQSSDDKEPKKPEEPKPEASEDKEEYNSGIPSFEEHKKRMEDALGTV